MSITPESRWPKRDRHRAPVGYLRAPDPNQRQADYEAFVKDLKGVRQKLEQVARAH